MILNSDCDQIEKLCRDVLSKSWELFNVAKNEGLQFNKFPEFIDKHINQSLKKVDEKIETQKADFVINNCDHSLKVTEFTIKDKPKPSQHSSGQFLNRLSIPFPLQRSNQIDQDDLCSSPFMYNKKQWVTSEDNEIIDNKEDDKTPKKDEVNNSVDNQKEKEIVSFFSDIFGTGVHVMDQSSIHDASSTEYVLTDSDFKIKNIKGKGLKQGRWQKTVNKQPLDLG